MYVLWNAYSGVQSNENLKKISNKNVAWSWKLYQIWNQRQILLRFDVSYVQIGQKLTDLRKFDVGELIEGQMANSAPPTSWTTWAPRATRAMVEVEEMGAARAEKKKKKMRKKRKSWLLY